MPYRAQNAVPITATFQAPAVYKWDIPDRLPDKIDAYCTTDTILQISEDPNGVFIDDQNQEILLRAGWSSRVFATPFTAYRFKVWSQSAINPNAGTVDFTVYS